MRRIAFGWLAIGVFALSACGTRQARSQAAVPVPERPVRVVCAEDGVPYPPKHIFLRAFKLEKQLELWGLGADGKMHLLHAYAIAAASGGPGPKRREGDMQVPEGVYRIEKFNPHSQFHLSLGLNYPNRADSYFSDPRAPGGDIYIHGNQVSIGCLAMTDAKIDEIYALASSARRPIPVHIFPCRMEGAAYASLRRQYPQFAAFWSQLQPVYARFEADRRVPGVSVSAKGAYMLKG